LPGLNWWSKPVRLDGTRTSHGMHGQTASTDLEVHRSKVLSFE
jgi:hypothetical protein